MDGAQITALTGLITVIGTGIGWLIVRWDKKRPAVPRKEAHVAHASKATAEALTAIQASLSSDLERVRREATEDREQHRTDRAAARSRLDALDLEVEGLRREVHTLRDAWDNFYADLRSRWSHHRQQSSPPPPPTLD